MSYKIFKKDHVNEELQKKLHQLKKQYIVRNSQAKLSQKKLDQRMFLGSFMYNPPSYKEERKIQIYGEKAQ